MKATIKLKSEGRSNPDWAEMTFSDGQKIETLIDFDTLGPLLRDCKRVEFSNEYFNGSTKIPLKGDYAGSKRANGNYICGEWVSKLGLNDVIYVKVRR